MQKQSSKSSAGAGSAAPLIVCAAIALAALALAAPAGATETTIGANVNQPTGEAGTCGFKEARERPCILVWDAIPGQAMASPCDGTITRFRINGIPRPNDHYALRVVTKNTDGSYTGTATSSTVSVATEGVNEYATSLPISTGQEIGLDFLDSTEEHGVRLVGEAGVTGGYFYAFPADGGTAPPTGNANGWHYLFNADVHCTPSNAFKVLKLTGTTATVELSSAGTLAIADAAKGKAKTLKPSTATGGPGTVAIGLKLNAAAKAKLAKKGKVKIKAKLTFTPTGGEAATQVRSFTIKKKVHRH
jgi:hypothetical protein